MLLYAISGSGDGSSADRDKRHGADAAAVWRPGIVAAAAANIPAAGSGGQVSNSSDDVAAALLFFAGKSCADDEPNPSSVSIVHDHPGRAGRKDFSCSALL